MNKTIYIIVMSVAFLLAGCSAEERALVKEVSEKTTSLKEDPQLAEEEFIKSAIEYSVEINNDIHELRSLLERMDVTNSNWNTKATMVSNKLWLNANGYLINEKHLNDEQKDKYSNTIELYNQGLDEMNNIYNGVIEAQKTYDKKALQEILLQLEPANELIQKAVEQLEIEQYK